MKNLILIPAMFLINATGFAQLVNTDFESWVNPVSSTINNNRPVGWFRSNGLPNNPITNFYHPPTTNAQNGNYALRMSIWYTYDLDMANQTAPINYRPASLTGFYTYTDNQVYDETNNIINDIAKVTVTLSKIDAATGNKVVVGSGTAQFTATQSYIPFNCTVTYLSNEIPDTVEVEFDCSLMDKLNGYTVTPVSQASTASILTVDNIKLTPQSLSTVDFDFSSTKFYPNPSTGIVNFPAFDGHIKLYDVTGKMVKKATGSSGLIDITSLPSGIYILTCISKDKMYNTKIVKE